MSDGNPKQESACNRTGVCCQKLYVSTMPRIARIFLKRKMRKQYKNTKPAISKAWIEDGENAEKAGLQFFPCRFLTEDNVCSLQDKKPEVCSYSLSPSVLKEGAGIDNFFHHKCGYLNGAPEIIKRGSRILEEMHKIPSPVVSDKQYRRWFSLDMRLKELKKNEDAKGWSIVNKKWVKSIEDEKED